MLEKINDRILKVFQSLDIKQFEFADKIGVSQAYISKLFKENSDKNPSERIIKIICSEFNVNEEWLRTGKGEIFVSSETFSLDDYSRQNNLTALELDIIKGYIELDKGTRETILSHFKSIFDKHSEVATTVDTYVPHYEPISVENYYVNEIDEEVERYRLELEAEKKGQISLAYGDTKEPRAK